MRWSGRERISNALAVPPRKNNADIQPPAEIISRFLRKRARRGHGPARRDLLLAFFDGIGRRRKKEKNPSTKKQSITITSIYIRIIPRCNAATGSCKLGPGTSTSRLLCSYAVPRFRACSELGRFPRVRVLRLCTSCALAFTIPNKYLSIANKLGRSQCTGAER